MLNPIMNATLIVQRCKDEGRLSEHEANVLDLFIDAADIMAMGLQKLSESEFLSPDANKDFADGVFIDAARRAEGQPPEDSSIEIRVVDIIRENEQLKARIEGLEQSVMDYRR